MYPGIIIKISWEVKFPKHCHRQTSASFSLTNLYLTVAFVKLDRTNVVKYQYKSIKHFGVWASPSLNGSAKNLCFSFLLTT